VELPVPRSLDDVRRQHHEVAVLLGKPDRGRRIVEEIDSRLGRIARAPPSVRPKAIVLNPNGVTVGEGTLADEVMSRAGLANVAAMLKLDNYGQVPLETVVAYGVEVLILSASRDGPPALATEILKHPVFSRISSRTRLVVMPTRMWGCAGPAVVDAIELLTQVAREVRDKAILE
jgi:iron complex transport system substrate-binding protein